MPKFFLMCGIPASGKTTIAKKMAVEENAVIISFGDIKREKFKEKKYHVFHKKGILRLLRSKLTEALRFGQNVIVDMTNKTMSERKYYARRAKTYGYHTVCVFCQKSCEYAIIANLLRNGEERVLNKYITEIAAGFAVPDISEGWDEIIVYDGDSYSVNVEGQMPSIDSKGIYRK